MDATLSKDREIQVDALNSLLKRSLDLGIESVLFNPGDIILEQHTPNDTLFVIMEGEAELTNQDDLGNSISVDRLNAGNFLGIISFWTGQPSFSGSKAITHMRCVKMQRKRFQPLMDEDREFNRVISSLMISNLIQRFRRMASLNVEVAKLTRDLEIERNSLRSTVRDLELTRNRLVHQEKLATMGQLLAGIAHEINNPSSALIKSVETLQGHLPQLFEPKAPLASFKTEKELLNLGLSSRYLSNQEMRERMEALHVEFPEIKRSLARRLAYLDEQGLVMLRPLLKKQHKKKNFDPLVHQLSFFEIGVYLRSIHSSVGRITSLVKSLKNYGRTDGSEQIRIDLNLCIQDTLVVLNHRLKSYALNLQLEELPEILCYPSEINQVLTNLLVNACDATALGDEILVDCGSDEDRIWIAISDRGTGIPEPMLDSIFDPNVTTKNSGGDFGLGLGLAISRDIVIKHGGTMTANNRVGGGACFTVNFPLVGSVNDRIV